MLIILHLSLMIAAALGLAAGIGMAMFGRRKKNWLLTHKKLNLAGLIIALAGAGMAFGNIAAAGEAHLEGLHQRMGLTAVLLLALTIFLGYASFTVQNKSAVRIIHRWSGRLSFLAMLANLLMGIVMIGIV